MRVNNRAADSLRPISVEWNIQPSADASLLIRTGNTHVICGVSIEETVPPFLKGGGSGWITAEYGMLPCATSSRYKREGLSGKSGRTHEIQRLIGRSLRMMVDLTLLGERTLRVDCDVLNADGGTRTAAITGAALALRAALAGMAADGRLATMPAIMPIAAISVGIVAGVPLLDLDYNEDSKAEADANFVMRGDNHWIEIQSTAEGAPFSNDLFLQMTALAQKGIQELLGLWSE
jgi:ribonuclease PH